MITKEQEENLKYIYKHFGWSNQKEKLHEEIQEFIQDSNSEELVDVFIVAYQLLKFDGLNKKTHEDLIDYKINRTLERIEAGYYEK